MSTNPLTPTIATTPFAEPSRPVRSLRYPTLMSVELRKMTDTRSGRWLLAVITGLASTALIWKVSHATIDVSFRNYGGAVTTVIGFLAPVIGLLAMTSEWTQRTALTTFTLAPRRLPVIAAKLASAIVLSLGVFVVGMVMSVAATAIGGAIHGHADFAGMAADLRGFAVIVLAQVLMAAAFGALAGHTAVALVAYLAFPTAWAAVSDSLLQGAAPWFDVFKAYDQLSSGQPFQHAAQSFTAITIWVIVPLVVGVMISLRREVK